MQVKDFWLQRPKFFGRSSFLILPWISLTLWILLRHQHWKVVKVNTKASCVSSLKGQLTLVTWTLVTATRNLLSSHYNSTNESLQPKMANSPSSSLRDYEGKCLLVCPHFLDHHRPPLRASAQPGPSTYAPIRDNDLPVLTETKIPPVWKSPLLPCGHSIYTIKKIVPKNLPVLFINSSREKIVPCLVGGGHRLVLAAPLSYCRCNATKSVLV